MISQHFTLTYHTTDWKNEWKIRKGNRDEKVQNQHDTNHIRTEVIVWLHTLINTSLCYVSVSLPTYSAHQPWQEWENALLFHSLCCFGKYRWPFIHDTWRLGSTTVIVQLANRPYTKAQKRKRAQKRCLSHKLKNYNVLIHSLLPPYLWATGTSTPS